MASTEKDAGALCSNIDAKLSSVNSGHTDLCKYVHVLHNVCVCALAKTPFSTLAPDVVQSKQEQTNVYSALRWTISHYDYHIFHIALLLLCFCL